MSTNKDWTGNKKSTYITLGASNHTDKERQTEDFYATDKVAIDGLKSVWEIPQNIWECACGEGDLSKRLEELGHTVYSTDLVDRGYGIGNVDFLKTTELPKDCTCILTNPPYKCYDIDTQCFTKRGWLCYNELTNEDEVLSLNPHTQRLEWSKIKNIIIREKEKNEKMYHFKKSHMDIMVTNGHRMYCFNKFNNSVAYKNDDLIKSEDIRSMHFIPREGYKWEGTNIEYFVLLSIMGKKYAQTCFKEDIKIPIESWLKFFGLWLADGYCRHTLNSNGNYRKTIGIKQSIKTSNKVREILNDLPFNYKELIDNYNRKNECINFEINNEQLWSYLKQFGKSADKFIPSFIKNLPTDKLKIFIESYFFGDGSQKNEFVRKYRSISKQLIEDIQEILLKLGNLTHITSYNYKTQDNIVKTVYEIYTSSKSIYNRIYFPSNKNEQCITDYEGKVWCVQLEKNGVFLLRRNGQEFFCGNCALEFVNHSLDLLPEGGYCVMFLKTTFLEGKKRYNNLFSVNPPKYMFQFVSRVLCAKNGDFETMIAGGGSAVSYAWFVFQKGYEGDTTIKWINNS